VVREARQILRAAKVAQRAACGRKLAMGYSTRNGSGAGNPEEGNVKRSQYPTSKKAHLERNQRRLRTIPSARKKGPGQKGRNGRLLRLETFRGEKGETSRTILKGMKKNPDQGTKGHAREAEI